jgi:type I restriction enzyme, S subunit
MVPEGWSNNTFEELFEFKNGINTDAANYGSGIKFVNIMDIFESPAITQDRIRGSVTISDKQVRDYQLQRGDVLFNRTSETPEEIAYASVYLDGRPAVFGGFVIRARPKTKRINPEFSKYCFRTTRVRRELIRRCQGAIRGNIGQTDMKEVSIMLPPPDEQVRITQILSTWDRAIGTVEKLIANSEHQKKALMRYLLTGERRLPGFSATWEKERLGALTRIYDGTHSTPKYTETGVPFYSVEHLTSGDFSSTKFISEDVFAKESQRVMLEHGDILMTRIGDIGTAKLIDWDVRASFYVSLALIKATEHFDSRYMANYIACDAFQRELFKRTIHVAFPKKINLGEIGECIVSLPPLDEQRAIASVLDTASMEIEVYAADLARLKSEKTALMQQLLTGKRRVKVGKEKAA